MWWHHIFFGLVFRTQCNADVVYEKLIEPSVRFKFPQFEFHHSITQSFVTLSKQPKVGRPLSKPSQVLVKKHRKVSYSLPNSIRLQNIGVHYVIYKSERGRCGLCSKRNIHSIPHSKCCVSNVFLCCNENKNFFKELHSL